MRARAFLTTAIAAIVLTACGGTGDTRDAGAASEAASQGAEPAPTSTVDPTPTPPVEDNDDRDDTPRKTDPSGPYDLVPLHLRVEERARGDRVVLTFRGRGTAGGTFRKNPRMTESVRRHLPTNKWALM